MKLFKTRFLRCSRGVGLCIVAMTAAFAAHAQNAIQAVTSSLQSGVEIIRIDFAVPLNSLPTGFSIQAPARIALDFPGTSNAVGRSSIEINQGNLRSVNVVQADE